MLEYQNNKALLNRIKIKVSCEVCSEMVLVEEPDEETEKEMKRQYGDEYSIDDCCVVCPKCAEALNSIDLMLTN